MIRYKVIIYTAHEHLVEYIFKQLGVFITNQLISYKTPPQQHGRIQDFSKGSGGGIRANVLKLIVFANACPSLPTCLDPPLNIG